MDIKKQAFISSIAIILAIAVSYTIYLASKTVVEKRRSKIVEETSKFVPIPTNFLLYPYWFSYNLKARSISEKEIDLLIKGKAVFVTNFLDFTPTFYSMDITPSQSFYTFQIVKETEGGYIGWIKVHTEFDDLTKFIRQDFLKVTVDPTTKILNKAIYKDEATGRSITITITDPKISNDGYYLQFVLEKDGKEKLMQFRRVALIPTVFDTRKLLPAEGHQILTLSTVAKEATLKNITMLENQIYVLEGFYSSLVDQKQQITDPVCYMIKLTGQYDKATNTAPFDFIVASLSNPDEIYRKDIGAFYFEDGKVTKISLGLPKNITMELRIHKFLINPTSNVLSLLVVKNIAEVGSIVTSITLKRIK